MLAVTGTLAALLEASRNGRGQVVESAMSDGALALMALFYAMRDADHWIDERGANQPQGGAPFYRCYETLEGAYMAVGAVENKFYAELIDGLGLDPALVATPGTGCCGAQCAPSKLLQKIRSSNSIPFHAM